MFFALMCAYCMASNLLWQLEIQWNSQNSFPKSQLEKKHSTEYDKNFIQSKASRIWCKIIDRENDRQQQHYDISKWQKWKWSKQFIWLFIASICIHTHMWTVTGIDCLNNMHYTALPYTLVFIRAHPSWMANLAFIYVSDHLWYALLWVKVLRCHPFTTYAHLLFFSAFFIFRLFPIWFSVVNRQLQK